MYSDCFAKNMFSFDRVYQIQAQDMKKTILVSWMLWDIWKNIVTWLYEYYDFFGISSGKWIDGIANHFQCDMTQSDKIKQFVREIKHQNIFFDWIIFNTCSSTFKDKSEHCSMNLLQTVLYSPIYIVTNILENIKDDWKIVFLCSLDRDKTLYRTINHSLAWFTSAMWKKFRNISLEIIDLDIKKEEIRKSDIFSLLLYKDMKLKKLLSKINWVFLS